MATTTCATRRLTRGTVNTRALFQMAWWSQDHLPNGFSTRSLLLILVFFCHASVAQALTFKTPLNWISEPLYQLGMSAAGHPCFKLLKQLHRRKFFSSSTFQPKFVFLPWEEKNNFLRNYFLIPQCPQISKPEWLTLQKAINKPWLKCETCWNGAPVHLATI